jgi:hypothetical protein
MSHAAKRRHLFRFHRPNVGDLLGVKPRLKSWVFFHLYL